MCCWSVALAVMTLMRTAGARVSIVGHSRGGVLAKVLSSREPEAVEQAVQRGGRGPSTSVTGIARYVVATRCTSAAVTASTARRYRSGYAAPTPSTS